MRLLQALVSVMAVLAISSAHAQNPSQNTGRLVYLGSIAQNRALLQSFEDDGDRNLLVSPEVGYLLIHRANAGTTTTVSYRGGSRDLPFTRGNVTQLRIVIQRGQRFRITGRTAGAVCFSSEYVLSTSGVWRLDLPC